MSSGKNAVQSDLWQQPEEARRTLEDLHRLTTEQNEWQTLHDDLITIAALATAADPEDQPFLDELQEMADDANKRVRNKKLHQALTGPYDGMDTILTVSAGSGGTEAQYWAETLAGMYCRWAKHHSISQEIISSAPGPNAGYRNVTFLFSGPNAHGLLSTEVGVHRLSRVSTFDPDQRRHTSFASVETMPDIPHTMAPEPISRNDLKVDVFHASGHGGQHIQKWQPQSESPTCRPVSSPPHSQNARKSRNRENAMRILSSRIHTRLMTEHRKTIEQTKQRADKPQWSNQIRSYILNPKQMVIDHRTKVKNHDAAAVLDGDIDQFMEAMLMKRRE